MNHPFDEVLIDKAILHAKSIYPEESCGFITKDDYLPMINISEDKENNFEIDAKEYMRLDGKIEAIIHSHANYPHASKQDMISQIKSNVPWGIIFLKNGATEHVAFFGDQIPPYDLIGRPFIHGIFDCYAIVRDYYRMKGITIPIFSRENLWWESQPSMLEDGCKDAGFEFIDKSELKEGDVIFMKIMAKVVNHSAIYLGNNLIVHHIYNKLSRREPFTSWQQYASGYLRYQYA